MKIERIDFPAPNANGLGDIKMDRLSPVVIIAGKNGAGKTRLLNLVRSRFNSYITYQDIVKKEAHIDDLKTLINRDTNSTSKLRKQLGNHSGGSGRDNQLNKELSRMQSNLRKYQDMLDNNKSHISKNKQISISGHIESSHVVDYVPKQTSLEDCNDFSKNVLIAASDSVTGVGVNNLPKGTLANIQHIQDRWRSATHPESSVSLDEKEYAIDEYLRLNELIEVFFGTKLGRDLNDDATINNFSLGKANLSDGQTILLQLCVAIHAQHENLNDMVLIMDEPENHLHPSLVIEIIDKIRTHSTNGQIWIATHSVPLLAYFDPSYIWYMENGTISHAGRKTEKVLEGLLGNEDNINKISNFISLPAQFASNQFAFECLLDPAIAEATADDPQSSQINEIINGYLETGKTIRVLDYGAGNGRLASTIHEAENANKDEIKKWLDYVAFDPSDTGKGLCQDAIGRIYETHEQRYFNSRDTLLSSKDTRTFDFVVMCNVLHELDPVDWLTTFSDDGLILKLLKEDGNLIIVEDQLMPIGEKAYKNGFLVLDTLPLKRLFKIEEADADFKKFDARGDGRLKAFIIPCSYINRIDAESRKEAITEVKTSSKGKIKTLREKEATYKNGMALSFWLQQHANSTLILDELG